MYMPESSPVSPAAPGALRGLLRLLRLWRVAGPQLLEQVELHGQRCVRVVELRRVAERLISKAKRLGKVAYTPQADLSPGDRAKRLHAERLVGRLMPATLMTASSRPNSAT